MISKYIKADGCILFYLKDQNRWDSCPCMSSLSILSSSADLVRRSTPTHFFFFFKLIFVFSFVSMQWILTNEYVIFICPIPTTKNRILIFWSLDLCQLFWGFLPYSYCYVGLCYFRKENQWFLCFHIQKCFTIINSPCVWRTYLAKLS